MKFYKPKLSLGGDEVPFFDIAGAPAAQPSNVDWPTTAEFKLDPDSIAPMREIFETAYKLQRDKIIAGERKILKRIDELVRKHAPKSIYPSCPMNVVAATINDVPVWYDIFTAETYLSVKISISISEVQILIAGALCDAVSKELYENAPW